MKDFLRSVIIVIIIICGIAVYFGHYMLNVAVRPEIDRRHQLDSCYARVYNKYPELQLWHDSLVAKGTLRDTFLLADDGTKRHGLILRHDSLSNGTSLVLHGYDDNAVVMMRYFYMHYEVLGRDVIVPEHFNHGLSDGDHIRFGWLDRLDIKNLWIPLAHQLWPKQDIVVHGLSMGGAITMFTSGEEFADSLRVKAFIEDCGFSSTWDILAYQLKTDYGMPSFPILNIADWFSFFRFGWDFKGSDAVKQVAKCKKPMLFIHGDADDFVPTDMVFKCYEAKKDGYKELWIVPGAEHARSIHENWEEYCERCEEFINRVGAIQ